MCFEDKPLATVQADTPSDDEEVHVVIDALWSGIAHETIMWCGLVVTWDADDNPSADFYTETWRDRATCGGCREALGARSLL